jgi:hypothetical protein
MKTVTQHRAYWKIYREQNKERIIEANKRWRKANTEKIKEYNRTYRLRPEALTQKRKRIEDSLISDESYRIRYLLIGARNRAAKRGMDFDSGLLEALLRAGLPVLCPCCNLKIDYANLSRTNGKQPSLDRMDNKKGYTVANVKIICFRCNILKNAATITDIKNILAYMERG